MPGDRVEQPRVVVDAELVGDGQQQCVGGAHGRVLPQFCGDHVGRPDIGATEASDHTLQVPELIVARIAERLETERGIKLTVDPELLEQLAHEGFDAEFGARPLKRHLRRTLEKELTRAILDGTIADGGRIVARDDGGDAIVLEVAEPAVV